MCRYERHTIQSQTGLGNPENSTTMLQVFSPAEYNISFHKRENVIPIHTNLNLVILLSCTYYFPLRLKKKNLLQCEIQIQALSVTLGDIINETTCVKIQRVCYTKAPFCFYLSVLEAVLCWCAARTGTSSNYFREILSITGCETAWISHVCPVKLQNGPICSILIRFLPAETAIIFLSPGFSLWPHSDPVFTWTKKNAFG